MYSKITRGSESGEETLSSSTEIIVSEDSSGLGGSPTKMKQVVVQCSVPAPSCFPPLAVARKVIHTHVSAPYYDVSSSNSSSAVCAATTSVLASASGCHPDQVRQHKSRCNHKKTGSCRGQCQSETDQSSQSTTDQSQGQRHCTHGHLSHRSSQGDSLRSHRSSHGDGHLSHRSTHGDGHLSHRSTASGSSRSQPQYHHYVKENVPLCELDVQNTCRMMAGRPASAPPTSTSNCSTNGSTHPLVIINHSTSNSVLSSASTPRPDSSTCSSSHHLHQEVSIRDAAAATFSQRSVHGSCSCKAATPRRQASCCGSTASASASNDGDLSHRSLPRSPSPSLLRNRRRTLQALNQCSPRSLASNASAASSLPPRPPAKSIAAAVAAASKKKGCVRVGDCLTAAAEDGCALSAELLRHVKYTFFTSLPRNVRARLAGSDWDSIICSTAFQQFIDKIQANLEGCPERFQLPKCFSQIIRKVSTLPLPCEKACHPCLEDLLLAIESFEKAGLIRELHSLGFPEAAALLRDRHVFYSIFTRTRVMYLSGLYLQHLRSAMRLPPFDTWLCAVENDCRRSCLHQLRIICGFPDKIRTFAWKLDKLEICARECNSSDLEQASQVLDSVCIGFKIKKLLESPLGAEIQSLCVISYLETAVTLIQNFSSIFEVLNEYGFKIIK